MHLSKTIETVTSVVLLRKSFTMLVVVLHLPESFSVIHTSTV